MHFDRIRDLGESKVAARWAVGAAAQSCTWATRPSQQIRTPCYQPSAHPGSDTHKSRCSNNCLCSIS
jgi:hypothetical protein